MDNLFVEYSKVCPVLSTCVESPYYLEPLPGGGYHQLECMSIYKGRYVSISKPESTGNLALCEVQVFGSK